MSQRAIVALGMGVILLGGAATRASADATLLTQDRSAAAEGAFQLFTDSQVAVTFDPVNLIATINGTSESGDYFAQAIQNSSVGASLFSNSGSVTADFTPAVPAVALVVVGGDGIIPPGAIATSSYETRFTLATRHDFSLDYSFVETGISTDESYTSRLTLVREDDDVTIIDSDILGDSSSMTDALSPGTYKLFMIAKVVDDENVPADATAQADITYSMTMSLTDQTGSVIPLPPAVWSAISTLGGVGVLGAIRRRSRRAGR